MCDLLFTGRQLEPRMAEAKKRNYTDNNVSTCLFATKMKTVEPFPPKLVKIMSY